MSIQIDDKILQKAEQLFPRYSGQIGSRFKDLSGQKIGQLLLLYRGENDPLATRPRARYVCLCDCGNIVLVRGENIQQRKNNNPSCGKCKEYQFSLLDELENFYILDTYFDTEDQGGRYHCIIQCKDCGAIYTPRRSDLYNDFHRQCTKCKCDTFKIGDVIGELTLVDRKVDEDNRIKWLCKCSCGETLWLSGFRLHHRMTCGNHNNPNDIVGQVFGKLCVKEATNISRGGQRIYLCDCECGTTNLEVGRSNLITGHTSSCGCLKSKGEELIASILTQHGLEFEKQKTFKDFKRSIHGSFKFDFFVNNSYAIEFDGSQHFNHHKFVGWFSEENLAMTRERDAFKNQYCFHHNIPLIRIPYWEKDNLTIEDLIPTSSRFLLTPENEEQYYQN